jgi:hypothetical protein
MEALGIIPSPAIPGAFSVRQNLPQKINQVIGDVGRSVDTVAA